MLRFLVTMTALVFLVSLLAVGLSGCNRATSSGEADTGGASKGPDAPLSGFSLAAAKTQNVNNLRQLGLAINNYTINTNGKFPAALCDKNGKPVLSWRVALLPLLEQSNLQSQFKLDEPWDSAHNKKLLTQMPKVFAPVVAKGAPEGGTYYQLLVGPGSLCQSYNPPPTNLWAVFAKKGSINLITVVEASKTVPWTAPEDVAYDEKQLPTLGGQFPDGFHAAMGDGSVNYFKRNIKPEALRYLASPNPTTNLPDWDTEIVR